jgi:hypothetical protein
MYGDEHDDGFGRLCGMGVVHGSDPAVVTQETIEDEDDTVE